MTFQTDIATDHLMFDGTITVTLKQRRAGSITSITINNVTQGPLTFSQMTALGGVGLNGSEKSWSLNSTEVGANGVKKGDLLNDGNNDWEILMATYATLGARWKVAAKRLG